MDFMAAFPDADFDLMTRYFSMEPAAGEDNVLTMAAGGGEVNVHESLFCSFLPAEMMNYSTTTTTTTTTTNSSSGNNSPLFDPVAQEISYYDDHHHYHFAPPSTNFFNVEEETAAHYSISDGGFPFEAPAIVPSVEWQLKRKLQSHVPVSPSDKKRPRRNQKSCNHRQEEEATSNDVTNNGQSSSSCNSEEEIVNGSSSSLHEGEAQKSRTSRGSATDPQSIYARKRRERINERLRILQTLVPNGTKVDISTMLEEAVHYVKFLQLQIKLLSSDNLWMYAPIAYNGVDVGLNQKLSTLL